MDRLYRTSSWLNKVFELAETSVQNFLKSPRRNTFSSSALLSGPSVVLLFHVVKFKVQSTFSIITLLHGVYDGLNYNTDRLIFWFLRIYFVICPNINLKKLKKIKLAWWQGFLITMTMFWSNKLKTNNVNDTSMSLKEF